MDSLETKLFPGDKVELTYRLLQGGTWFVAWQVGNIERDLEADGRFRLLRYIYNEEANTVRFDIEYRVTPVSTEPQTQRAGFGAILVAVVAAFVAGVAFAWLYEPPVVKVIRAQQKTAEYVEQVRKDPDLTDAEKDEIVSIATTEPPATETTTAKITTSIAAIIIGGLALYFLTRKD